MLRQPPEDGSPEQEGLGERSSHEHLVVRGAESEAAVLIAARKDNTTVLE